MNVDIECVLLCYYYFAINMMSSSSSSLLISSMDGDHCPHHHRPQTRNRPIVYISKFLSTRMGTVEREEMIGTDDG